MNQQQLVSIIIIFLNEESFIEEAIASVFAQTYDHWELLLVDDGSSDRSTEIAQQCAEQSAGKVRYLEHENHQNRGMSASRNLGIRWATGEYISFLDGDDIWLPHKLEQQVAIIGSQPEAGLVCGRAKWWYDWTGNLEDSQRDFIQRFDTQLDTLVQPPTVLLLFLKDEWASLCDILVRRQLVEAVGGYEESFRGMYEDQVFHAKLCLQAPAFVSSQCWYWYRQHSLACTLNSHQTGQTYFAKRNFLRWLKAYVSKQQIENTELSMLLREKLRPYQFQHRLLGKIQHLAKQMQSFTEQAQ